jgi:hypothetical protein
MLEKRIIHRLDKLISKGNELLTYEPSEEELERHREALRASVVDEWDPDPTDEVDDGAFAGWRAQTLFFLRNTLGNDHFYVKEFESQVRSGYKAYVISGQNILRVVKEDVEDGFLTDIRTLVAAEVFADFLDMAKHLHERGYKDRAAFLAGAVLENGLRRIASAKEIKVKNKDDLSTLNNKLADVNVYTRMVQKQVKVWIDLRNHADHSRFEQYSNQEVTDMMRGVENLLANHL